jgi:hypothetical protein
VPTSRIGSGAIGRIPAWLLSASLLVGCVSGVASPTPSASASARLSVEPSAEASPTPSGPTGTPGSTDVLSTQPATTVPTWEFTGSMITAHAFHTSTLLPDGRVLVVGGLVNDRLDGQASAAAELYDPNGGSWTATQRMTDARWGHTATLLPNGKVLVAGGYVNGTDSLDSAELYDPSSGRWTATGRMATGRGGHAATLLPDGTVLIVGGGAEDTLLEGGPRSATAEVYDPGSGNWTTAGNLTEARKGFTVTLLADGTVLVAGGDASFTAAELYDPRSGRWTATGSMAQGRFGHTATLLTDGSVLVTGGCACSDPGALASAELYQPSTRRWIATGDMGTARIFHAATKLTDGSVLVVNDGLRDDRPGSAELYDPGAGQWAATASPARARYGYTITLLLDGKVLLLGDYDPSSQALVELYDPGR